jgi:predicted aspartyl protease
VFIGGHGPFAFALDTGASHSVIDQDLADRLGLPSAGPAVEVTGVAATAEAGQVRVGGWRVGDVLLPGDTVVTIGLSEPNRRLKMRGLLGSDVLSRFGAVTVDYDHQKLLLHARP